MSNINITSKNTGKISVSVKPSTPVTISPKAQTNVSIKGVVGATHDLTGTDFGLLYKSGDNKISTSVVTYNANTQLVTFPGGISPASIFDTNGSRGTAGQILSSTGTALDWISLTEIAGVNGSGTANYVAKWTDGDSITNSSIYDNGTNVGIGTSSPDYKLQVGGTLNAEKIFINNTVDGHQIGKLIIDYFSSGRPSLRSYGNDGIRFDADVILGASSNNIQASANHAADLYFKHDRTGDFGFRFQSKDYGDIFRIKADGNVGIGTTSPTSKTEIVTTDVIDVAETSIGLKVNADQTGTSGIGGGTKYGVVIESSQNFNKNIGTRAVGLYIPAYDGTVYAGSLSAHFEGKLYLGGDNTLYSVNPYGLLTLDGTASTSNINDNTIFIQGIGLSGEAGVLGGITTGTNTANVSSAIHFVSGGANRQSHIVFKSSRDGSLAERMRITDEGNVGIGTTNPFAQLEIKKDSYTSAIVRGNSDVYKRLQLAHGGNFAYVTGSRSQLMLQSGDATYQYPMHFYTGGSARMVIDEAGRVGIGTTSPYHKFHIAQSSDWNAFRITGYDDQSSDYLNIHIGTTPMVRYQTNLAHNFYVNNASVLEVGTVVLNKANNKSNDNLLHIFGNNNDVYLGYSSADDKFKIGFTSTGTPNVDSNTVFELDASGVNVTGSFDVTGATTFDSDLTVSGNLTVNGTTTTLNTTELTIEDKNIVLANGAADAAAADGAGITIDGADATLTYDSTNDEFDFNKNIRVHRHGDNDVAEITLETDRSFGRTITVGTTGNSPYVKSYNHLYITAYSGNDTPDTRIYLSGGGSDDHIAFSTNEAERVRITNSGVGIGTTAPAAKLDIVGSGNTTSTKSLNIVDSNSTNRFSINDAGGLYSYGFDSSIYSAYSSGDKSPLLFSHSGYGVNTPDNTAINIGFRGRQAGGVNSYDYFTYKVYDNSVGTNVTTGFEFYTHQNQVSNADSQLAMSINGGNVGIGTDSPSAKLEVGGSKTITVYSPSEPAFISIKPTITDNNNSNNTKQEFLSIAPKYTINYGTGGSASTPKTGVSITPIYKGSTGVNNDANGVYALYSKPTFDSNIRNVTHYGIYLDSPSYSNTSGRTYYPIYVEEGNSYFGGNVGIGTTSPTQKLDVNGYIASSRLVGRSTTGLIAGSHVASSYALGVQYNSNQSATSGDKSILNAFGNWNPSSGLANFNGITVSPTLNQTGTALGGARGFYYNPTVTSVLGTHRAIETTAGDVIFNGGNVGIGTASPDKKLTIYTDGSADGLNLKTVSDFNVGSIVNANSNTTPVGSLFLNYGSTNTVLISAGSNRMALRGGWTTGGQISFSSWTTEMMRLTSTGLGIGTTAPASTFHTVGKSTEDIATLGNELLNAQTASGTGWTGVDIEQGYTHIPGNSDTLVTTFIPNINTVYVIDIAVTGLTAGRIDFIYLGGQSRPVYTGNTASRKVAIRTTTTDPLEVLAQSATDGTISFLSIKEVSSSTPSVSFGNGTDATALEFRIPNANNIYIGKNAGTKRTSEFNTTNIGIGYSSLANNVEGTQNVALGSNTLGSTANSSYNIALGGGVLQYYKHSGNTYNIGIGHNIMSGSAITTANSNIALGFWGMSNITTASSNIGIGYDIFKNLVSGTSNVSIGSASSFNLTTGGANVAIGLYALNGGTTVHSNVAIGYGAGRYVVGNSPLTTGNFSIFIGRDTKGSAVGTTNEIVIGHEAEGIGANSVVLGNDSITTTALKGNVGIGTTSPAYKLDVSGDIRSSSNLLFTSGTHSLLWNGSNTSIVGVANGYLSFKTGNGTERIRITDLGIVGIGTTSPVSNYKLHVVGSSRTALLDNSTLVSIVKITNSGTGNGAYNGLDFVANSTTNTNINSHGMPLTIATSNTNGVQTTERMRITGDGNVGIGTASPDASAILELDSTTQGVLFPRMTEGNRTSIASPATGLIVYQTDGDEGLYIYKSTGWIQII